MLKSLFRQWLNSTHKLFSMQITERDITMDAFIEEEFVPFTEPPFGATLQKRDFIKRGMKHCVVLDISGRLVDPKCKELFMHVKRLIEKGEQMIVLNIEAVNTVDRSGVGSLVSCYVSIINSGGALLLANPTRKFQDYFKCMRFL